MNRPVRASGTHSHTIGTPSHGEVRHELDSFGNKTVLVAKAGLLGQANVGSSTVPVTTLGQTVNAGSSGTSTVGIYGGVGLDTALNGNFAFKIRLDSVVRRDGRNSLSTNIGLGGTF